jgi:hypothetical protein
MSKCDFFRISQTVEIISMLGVIGGISPKQLAFHGLWTDDDFGVFRYRTLKMTKLLMVWMCGLCLIKPSLLRYLKAATETFKI